MILAGYAVFDTIPPNSQPAHKKSPFKNPSLLTKGFLKGDFLLSDHPHLFFFNCLSETCSLLGVGVLSPKLY